MERCPWCLGNEKMIRYHDEEWGVPVHDDQIRAEVGSFSEYIWSFTKGKTYDVLVDTPFIGHLGVWTEVGSFVTLIPEIQPIA